ncbi:MAG: sensor histidine kinase [Pseudomonadota bacterium]
MTLKERFFTVQMAAALLTWLVASGTLLYQIATSSGLQYAGLLEPTALLLVVYLVAMVAACNDHWSVSRQRIANAIQLASVAGMAYLVPISYLPIFTIIWVAMAAGLYSARTCFVFTVVLSVAWYAVWEYHWFFNGAGFSAALYATFHAFAVLSSLSARRAEQARDETQALYRELVATQHLLSEASRQNERTRIARNLHDLVGHHLTALSINLQIAERKTDGEAKASIQQSRALAKLLLSDVREAVSTLRDESELDFRRALDLIVENVPQLNISLDIDSGLHIDDVEIADAVLRCIQEAITNTLRHANATMMTVKLWQHDSALRFAVQDNGSGAAALREGNGLTGMRERLRNVGGDIAFESSQGGFGLVGTVPLLGV